MAERRDEAPAAPEERTLEPWFAAARAERAEPSLGLLTAILADAGAVGAERAAGGGVQPGAALRPAVAEGALPARREGSAVHGRRRGLDGLGGWKGLAALAACAAAGFWIGIAGQVTIEDGTVWSGARAVAADTAPDDPVGAFFDLASAEG